MCKERNRDYSSGEGATVMAKLAARNKDNFIEALMAHAGYAPLVAGKSYKYRRHTGAGSYINDEKRATKQQIRTAYRRLGVSPSQIPTHSNPRFNVMSSRGDVIQTFR